MRGLFGERHCGERLRRIRSRILATRRDRNGRDGEGKKKGKRMDKMPYLKETDKSKKETRRDGLESLGAVGRRLSDGSRTTPTLLERGPAGGD